MTDIEFRGLTPSGGWVYGYLVECSESDSFITLGLPEGNAWRVDSKTVGQYVKLKDKSGRKIYEGDVVELFHEGINMDGSAVRSTMVVTELIRFHMELMSVWADIGEIVGNIYESPELGV